MRFSHSEQIGVLQGQFRASRYVLSVVTPHGFTAYRAEDGKSFRVWTPDVTGSSRPIPDELLSDIVRDLQADPNLVGIVALPTGNELGFLADGTPFQARINGADENETELSRAFVRSYGIIFRDAFQASGGTLGIERSIEDAPNRKAYRDARMIRQSLYGEKVLAENLSAHPDGRSYRIRRQRVPQPYRILSNSKPYLETSRGRDLLHERLSDLDFLRLEASPKAPKAQVILVLGQAALGKSVFFSNYMWGHRDITNRSINYPFPYPLPVIPAQLIATEQDIENKDARFDALFKAIAQTEAVSTQLTEDMMIWMAQSGLAHLMFDGLDEFFSENSNFLTDIETHLLPAGARTFMTICLRESLLQTSGSLTEFIEGMSVRDDVDLHIFELLTWDDGHGEIDPELLETFAWLEFADCHPESDAAAEASAETRALIDEFMSAIRQSDVLRDVGKTPFHIKLFADLISGQDYFSGTQATPQKTADMSDLELLELAIQGLLKREWTKIRQGGRGEKTPIELAFMGTEERAKLAAGNVVKESMFGLPAKIASSLLGLPMAQNADQYAEAQLALARIEQSEAGLRELVEKLAHFARRGRDIPINSETIDELYKKQALPVGIGRAHMQAQLILQRFAMFERQDGDGLKFNHEIFADYLAGTAAAKMVLQDQASIKVAIGTSPSDDTGYFERTLLDKLSDASGLQALVKKALSR